MWWVGKRKERALPERCGALELTSECAGRVVCRQGSLGHSALVTPWLSLWDNSQVTSAPVAPRVGLRELMTGGLATLAGRRDY